MYFLKAMAEMFPNLGKPLPHTISPTTTTWNKVDRDIAQHTYSFHGDMISNLQSDVKELSTKVQQLQNEIVQLKNHQRTNPTINTTSNHNVFTAKKNAVVRYYASPPVQPILKKKQKVVNPYMAIKLKKQARVNEKNLATWPRK